MDPAKLSPSTESGPPPVTTGTTSAKFEGRALSNADVVALKSLGLSDELVVEKIRSAPAAYQMEVADIGSLKEQGFSEAVLKEMIAASTRR